MRKRASAAAISLSFLFNISHSSLTAADVRISSIQKISPSYNGYSASFGPGGRVGNVRPDGVVVLDANVRFQAGHGPSNDYRTDIFTTSGTGGVLSLISNSAVWVGGITPSVIPTVGNYVGNPWFCPTKGTVANTYMLFQAQNNLSMVGTPAQPGGGSDNDVWLYRPAIGGGSPTVWKLTNYGISGSTNLGPGVLGPQCSQDSDSNAPTLHIVYGHQILGPPSAAQSGVTGGLQCNGGIGPSNGTCWWFGQWELVYGDINFDPVTHLPTPVASCPMPCNEPYLVQSTIVHVNPRDVACSPICDITGTGTLTGNVLTVTGTPSNPLSTKMVGAGVHLSLTSGDFYATVQCYAGSHGEFTVSCSGATSVTLSAVPASGFTGSFEIHNFTLFEPHWYTSYGGDLYLSTSSQPVYHTGISAIFNEASGVLQSQNLLVPPYTHGGPVSTVPFRNTVWNEFLTPDPTLTHSLFMSDRATNPTNFAVNPEWSDHYLCSGQNCSNITRLTYYNDSPGLDAPPDQCPACYPVTAVRGAWLPQTGGGSSLQYITLVEFLSGESNPSIQVANLYLYTLIFPNTEVSGHVVISGKMQVGTKHP